MLPRHHPDRVQITFDDHRLVANAGLIVNGAEKLGQCGGGIVYHRLVTDGS